MEHGESVYRPSDSEGDRARVDFAVRSQISVFLGSWSIR